MGSCCYPLPLIPREETSQVSNGKGVVVFKCTVLFSSGFIVISPAEQQGCQSVYCQSGMCKQEQSLLPVMENIKYTMWKLIKKKKKKKALAGLPWKLSMQKWRAVAPSPNQKQVLTLDVQNLGTGLIPRGHGILSCKKRSQIPHPSHSHVHLPTNMCRLWTVERADFPP